MKIDYINGLLQTSITITYKGKSIVIDKLVIDTGASHSLLSADIVSLIDVFFENSDEIVNSYGIGGEESSYRKMFQRVQLGDFEILNFKLDIGALHEHLDIHGLIGLDLLIAANMIIDLNKLAIYPAIIN
ncbi:hypothetical protein EHS13_24840 [Paenibacillus psychroresistens]|uniref:Aspartyl protease n=1 Tax=Paenibacillus psychroresistens TaxID=1778678 RepID=A0A6B8RQB1_9BACL|nr:retropepsin-like aspartic protease [Paenibacillus psychroresistens]QGQ97882.1 hypothetical protein EHS13_24840 [Paenibacillus psychroresistens]